MAGCWAGQSFKIDQLTFSLQWAQRRKPFKIEKNKNKPVSPCLFFPFKTDPFFQDWFQSVQALWWSPVVLFSPFLRPDLFLFFSAISVPAGAASSLLLDAFPCLVFLLASACFYWPCSAAYEGGSHQPHPDMPLLTECSTQWENLKHIPLVRLKGEKNSN